MRRIRQILVVALAILVGQISGLAPARAEGAPCARVVGGSQTENWVRNMGFDSLIVNAEWEFAARGGQSIDRWGSEGTGWATRVRSSCTPTTVPTRLVLQVLPGPDSSFDAVSANIAAALAAVPTKLPSVTRVTLIPPVAGYDCAARLSVVQPVAIDAINANLGPTVDIGPIVMVPSCSMFRDGSGHLTTEGGQYAAKEYAAGL